jgi:site-specific recombinase XerD
MAYDLTPLIKSWQRSLRARGLSPNTQHVYQRAAYAFNAYLAAYEPGEDDRPAPTRLEGKKGIHREHVESFITQLRDSTSAVTAHQYFRSLKTFFNWCVDEEEMDRTPMRTMKAPQLPDTEVPIIPQDALKKLLKTCAGKSFENRRDTALLMMFLDTGARLSELTERTHDKLDLDLNVLHVLGKGNRERPAPFGRATSVAMDRYLRALGKHLGREVKGSDPLWVSSLRKETLTTSGVAKLLERRCKDAGLERIHPHQFRHTFAHLWKANGGNEDALMRIMGWRSREMLSRYGKSAGEERARAQHQELSPGDKL